MQFMIPVINAVERYCSLLVHIIPVVWTVKNSDSDVNGFDSGNEDTCTHEYNTKQYNEYSFRWKCQSNALM